jgi:hypothetical protein
LQNNGGCHANAVCTNTPGSFTCACSPGYAGNGFACEAINNCATNNGGCHGVNGACTMTGPAQSKCSCRAGFEGDGKKCVKKQCHPLCRWECDDPRCPAVCHPVCKRPNCRMQCKQTPCPKCVTHCEQPACTVRCPPNAFDCHSKKGGRADGCPGCETVCAPPKCHTACESAPVAECTAQCDDNPCFWDCKKPTVCPRPKCRLRCDKPVCSIEKAKAGKKGTLRKGRKDCCACSKAENVLAAMRLATAQHRSESTDSAAEGEADADGEEDGTSSFAPELPSLMEVMADMKAAERDGEGHGECCPC